MAAEPLPARRHEGETEDERLDRNWGELLQELRVAQTGVQILLGFLLTVPFSQRFADVSTTQERIYLVVLCGAVLASALLVAPAAFHRVLFRRGLRRWLVDRAHRVASAGLAVLALTLTGVVWLLFDVVAGRTAAMVAGGATLLLFAALWGLWPALLHRHGTRDED